MSERRPGRPRRQPHQQRRAQKSTQTFSNASFVESRHAHLTNGPSGTARAIDFVSSVLLYDPNGRYMKSQVPLFDPEIWRQLTNHHGYPYWNRHE